MASGLSRTRSGSISAGFSIVKICVDHVVELVQKSIQNLRNGIGDAHYTSLRSFRFEDGNCLDCILGSQGNPSVDVVKIIVVSAAFIMVQAFQDMKHVSIFVESDLSIEEL